MGQWTLTIVGEDVASNLGPAFSALATELEKAGHRIKTARVLTDNGESTIDVNSLIVPTVAEPVAPEPAPPVQATADPVADLPADTTGTSAAADPTPDTVTTEGA